MRQWSPALALLMLIALTAASASAAVPVTLLVDGRSLLARSNQELDGSGNPIGCLTTPQTNSASPAPAFSSFTDSLQIGGAVASQTSQVIGDSFVGVGSAQGYSHTCSNVYGESVFYLDFEVDAPIEVVLTGSVGASEGSASVSLRQGTQTLYWEGVVWATAPLDYAGVLQPGAYRLTASADSWEGSADWDFVFAMTTAPAPLPLLAPVVQGLLVCTLVACGLALATRD